MFELRPGARVVRLAGMAHDADPKPAPDSPASAGEKLPVDIRDKGAWTVVRLREPSLMDPAVIEALNTHVESLLARNRSRLILDFEQVQYISSSMVGVLVGTRQSVAKSGGELVLCALNPRLLELLKITRLDKMFVVEPDLRAALERTGLQ